MLYILNKLACIICMHKQVDKPHISKISAIKSIKLLLISYMQGTYESSSLNSINSSNNSNVYISGENKNCTKLSWSQQSNNASKCFECTDGGICENFLHQWSQCAVGSASNLLHVGVTKQEQSQRKETIGRLNVYLSNGIIH